MLEYRRSMDPLRLLLMCSEIMVRVFVCCTVFFSGCLSTQVSLPGVRVTTWKGADGVERLAGGSWLLEGA